MISAKLTVYSLFAIQREQIRAEVMNISCRLNLYYQLAAKSGDEVATAQALELYDLAEQFYIELL